MKMQMEKLTAIAIRLAIVFSCCCLTSCGSRTDNIPSSREDETSAETPTTTPADFKGRQKQLFYDIDHKLVHQGCQELMRLHKEGRLTTSTYYCDDPAAKLSELPEPIRALQPTDVQVIDIMITIGFLSEDGWQSLRCISNEFGEPAPSNGNAKGLGFRKEPFGMDRLSGTESLDYLNETFNHFEMELIPGLSYQTFKDEQPRTLEEVKQSNQQRDMLFAHMTKTMAELAVKKQRLLYQTDHHELLQACRESIARFNNGTFSRAKIDAGDEGAAEDLKRIPQVILNLEPVYIWFEENRVMVALIGGFDHAGACAYAKDEDATSGDDDMKLIDGLRYYDDGLREADEDYKDYLKSLQDEALTYLDWKRKQVNPNSPQE